MASWAPHAGRSPPRPPKKAFIYYETRVASSESLAVFWLLPRASPQTSSSDHLCRKFPLLAPDTGGLSSHSAAQPGNAAKKWEWIQPLLPDSRPLGCVTSGKVLYLSGCSLVLLSSGVGHASEKMDGNQKWGRLLRKYRKAYNSDNSESVRAPKRTGSVKWGRGKGGQHRHGPVGGN